MDPAQMEQVSWLGSGRANATWRPAVCVARPSPASAPMHLLMNTPLVPPAPPPPLQFMNNPEMQNAMQQLMADPGVRQAMEQQVRAWLLLSLGPPCLGLNRKLRGCTLACCRASSRHHPLPMAPSLVPMASCCTRPALQMTAMLSTPEGRAQMGAMLEASPMYQRWAEGQWRWRWHRAVCQSARVLLLRGGRSALLCTCAALSTGVLMEASTARNRLHVV